MGGGGPTTGSCAGLCAASLGGICIKEAEIAYRRGSANLKFGVFTINISVNDKLISP